VSVLLVAVPPEGIVRPLLGEMPPLGAGVQLMVWPLPTLLAMLP